MAMRYGEHVIQERTPTALNSPLQTLKHLIGSRAKEFAYQLNLALWIQY